MKRIFIALISMTSFIFCTACQGSGSTSVKPKQMLGDSFSSDFVLEMDDFTAEGIISKYDSGIWSVYFEMPSEVAGVQLDFNGDKTEASYKGLSFSVPQAALPSKAVIAEFIKAADEISGSEDITGSKKDDLIELDGDIEGEKYVLYLNGDGSPCEFRLDNMGSTLSFSNYSSDVKMTTTATTIESLVVTTTESDVSSEEAVQ